MKKPTCSDVGNESNSENVSELYPVANVRINTTIHTQHIDSKTALYRNRRGRVVWGERS